MRKFVGLYLNYRMKKGKKDTVYCIEVGGEVSGFCALLRMAVDYCCYADENGFYPYIQYNHNILYAEKGFFQGTFNPFEYYFKQPMDAAKYFQASIVKSNFLHGDSMEQKYNLKPFSYIVEGTYIGKMAEIYRKYIHLNEKTEVWIGRNIQNILGKKKTLGVHIRGTDFNKGFDNHPVPVTVEEYVKAIYDEVKEHHYEQIFIATDDNRCLENIKRQIHLPLVYYKNIMRADDNKSVAFKRSQRKHNGYLLGLEILKDMYTLAACDGFLGCLSQIDIFVQIIKKSKGKRFDSMRIIDKGVFHNGQQCWEPIR